MQITVQSEVPARVIADTMVSVVEGNYMTRSWVAAMRLREPTPKEAEKAGNTKWWYDSEPLWAGKFSIDVWEISDEHAYPGGFDPDDADTPLPAGLTKRTITHEDLAEGLKLMASKHASHFGDMMAENGDAITADVLLQLIVLKEIVYG